VGVSGTIVRRRIGLHGPGLIEPAPPTAARKRAHGKG